ncbi:S-adenosyl-L-methionine-dependent methyltransferase [Gorgonomyces haynaldii]|nr:S-adenosyl-L-methionine-dependent methyltransferase [Gorgonomyces haynaldii]
MNESGLMGTNDDALVSKLSAVELGYINDPFVKCFIKRGQKRPPIINRGTFTRTWIIDHWISEYIAQGPVQVVSLGAGMDTRRFRFPKITKYLELDFMQLTAKKAQMIYKSKLPLQNPTVTGGGTGIISDNYILLPCDLREWDPASIQSHLDPDMTTIFLSECVLVYLDPQIADNLIKKCSQLVNKPVFIVYEQILPHDKFGQQMIENLKTRNIHLPGLDKYIDLETQKQRYINNGFTKCQAIDFNQVWNMIPQDERDRVQKLELFDEIEEWQMLSAHYCAVKAE